MLKNAGASDQMAVGYQRFAGKHHVHLFAFRDGFHHVRLEIRLSLRRVLHLAHQEPREKPHGGFGRSRVRASTECRTTWGRSGNTTLVRTETGENGSTKKLKRKRRLESYTDEQRRPGSGSVAPRRGVSLGAARGVDFVSVEGLRVWVVTRWLGTGSGGRSRKTKDHHPSRLGCRDFLRFRSFGRSFRRRRDRRRGRDGKTTPWLRWNFPPMTWNRHH